MSDEEIRLDDLWQEANAVPSDLYYTEFRRAVMGGYDRSDVDTFRDHVAELFESLLCQVRDLKRELRAKEAAVEEYREMESALRNALMSSQKFNENVLDTARRQADAILAEACLARQRAQSEAHELPQALREEIAALKSQRGQLRHALHSLLAMHGELADRIPPAEEVAEQRASRLPGGMVEAPEPLKPTPEERVAMFPLDSGAIPPESSAAKEGVEQLEPERPLEAAPSAPVPGEDIPGPREDAVEQTEDEQPDMIGEDEAGDLDSVSVGEESGETAKRAEENAPITEESDGPDSPFVEAGDAESSEEQGAADAADSGDAKEDALPAITPESFHDEEESANTAPGQDSGEAGEGEFKYTFGGESVPEYEESGSSESPLHLGWKKRKGKG